MAQGKTVLVKQIKSLSGRDKRVRAAMRALGLRRIGDSSKLVLNSSVQGSLRKLQYLLSIESV